MRMHSRRGLNRRHFLKSTAATGLASLSGGLAMPSISRAADRPVITHGLQSGDVTLDRAVLWARADRPIGLIVTDKLANGKMGSEAIAQGREFEIADLLSFIKHAGIRNTVWLTADVHYTAAHYYDPDKAQFQDFEPFWEFVSGPLHADTFGPGTLDNTFGPQLRYVKAPSAEQGQNLPPSMGLQFFGHVEIAGDTGVMTVTLRDAADSALWANEIEPQLG